MGNPSVREFRLSPMGSGRGLSCDEAGAFVGSVPLLKRVNQGGIKSWEPRDSEVLSYELSKQFGLPIDVSSKVAGLHSVARALNAGDLTRAQLTALFLQVPELPVLPATTSRGDDLVALARALHASSLLAKAWEPDEHPRWPAGAPDGQGGQFAPKDGEGGQSSPNNRHDEVRVAANNSRHLRSWEEVASEQHLQPIGGSPVAIIPELAIDEAAVELWAELEAELDSGFALRPGPYAEESVPASGPGVTRGEQEAINEIGSKYGCHTCGTRIPGMKDGHWIGDHQPPTKMNIFGRLQSLFPHCLTCSLKQGGAVRQALRRLFGLGKLAPIMKGVESMPILERSVVAPNSLIFIDDPTHNYTIPGNTGGPLTYTSSCITVGTLESSRGDETTLRLGSDLGTPAGQLIFDGTIETPGRSLEVGNSWLERIFFIPVKNAVTHIRIWTNHPTEPDQIWIEAR